MARHTSSLLAACSLGAVLLAGAAAALVPLVTVTACGPAGCVCDTAGLLEAELGPVHLTQDAAWIELQTVWRPCCGELQSAVRHYRIDAVSGESARVTAARPLGASLYIEHQLGTQRASEVVLDGFAAGTRIIVSRRVHTLFSPLPVTVGRWQDPARGASAMVRVDLFGAGGEPLAPADVIDAPEGTVEPAPPASDEGPSP